jgi:hypothetical protein
LHQQMQLKASKDAGNSRFNVMELMRLARFSGRRSFAAGDCASFVLRGRLNWRAWNRAIGAKHAAIASVWLEHRATALALIEELAGIRRHRFRRPMITTRASDGGLELHRHHHMSLSRIGSRAVAQAKTADKGLLLPSRSLQQTSLTPVRPPDRVSTARPLPPA